MKKRPGGNNESNFTGNLPGAIDQTSSYTVSVWCKTSQASCFRIHINTTKNGSSYWGYGTGFHTGGGEWERLSVTVPANTGNTSINTIRCQALYTNITADAYFRDYQVEKNNHATPFILNGTRSSTQSLIDLKQTADIDLSNVSFDSNAQMTFDGTGDKIIIDHDSSIQPTSAITLEFIVKAGSSQGNLFPRLCDKSKYLFHLSQTAPYSLAFNILTSDGLRQTGLGSSLAHSEYTHVVATYDGQNGKVYKNNSLVATNSWSSTLPILNSTSNLFVGGNSSNTRAFNGEIPVCKIYDRVLSTQEVNQNYNALKNRFDL